MVDNIQKKIVYFCDITNIINSKYENELSKLLAEFQIINSVYRAFKTTKQSKLVNRDTPVFSIVKEASMPVKRSSPKRVDSISFWFNWIYIFNYLYYCQRSYSKNDKRLPLERMSKPYFLVFIEESALYALIRLSLGFFVSIIHFHYW